MPSRPVAALLALLLVAAAGTAVGATGSARLASPDRDDAQLQETATSPNTTMVMQVQQDGDVRWNVVTVVPVRGNDTASFDRLANRFEKGDGPGLGLEAFRRASEAASEATGREMDIREVERSSTVRNGTGRLVLSFTWTNFARETDGRLRVQDAFRTPSGTWLPGLAANQTLVIHPPEDYGVFGAPIGPDNGTLRWHGETTFEAGSPWAIYEGSETPTPTGPLPGEPPVWGVAVVAGVFGVAVLAFVLRGRDLDVPDLPNVTTSSDGGSDVDARARDSEPEPEAGSAPDRDPEPDDDEVDEELLSDEERVERLLEQNGGRMKQATIVKETGWSNAKVSQLLSTMAEEDRIEKLRLGRENLISFPDEDVTDFEN